ncbi:MAG: CoA transferase subunit A [Actinomycetota bacterium]|nr:CoA transferase subunit A [Actinomycetota bacterium]
MDKVLSVGEAIERFVPEGAGLVAVGGMHLQNNPMALVREMVRQDRHVTRLLTSPCGALNADLLVAAGLVEQIATSYVGFEHLGLAPAFRRAVEAGVLRVLECDEAYITHGLSAGAGGLPFVALPAGLEFADVWKANTESYCLVTDPFTGRKVLAGAPLAPDVALLHAAAADAAGNAVLAGAHFVDRSMALAAKTVVLQVERVVPTDQLSRQAVGTTIPGFLVQAVVEAPGGCHPTASHGHYRVDEAHLRRYLSLAASADGALSYLEEFVRGVTEQDYLRSVQAGASVGGEL